MTAPHDNAIAKVVGDVFVEWRRVFSSATSPLLILLDVVDIPTDGFSTKPLFVVFVSDATKAQMNHWNQQFGLSNYDLDITFNAEANENFKHIRLTGFSVGNRRNFHKDTTRCEPIRNEEGAA